MSDPAHTTVLTAVLRGVTAVPIPISIELSQRTPAMVIVGLADSVAREVSSRVRSALEASGYALPRQRATVTVLLPDACMGGAGLDLAIAIGILAADGVIPTSALADVLLVGELALTGMVRVVRGAVPLMLLAQRMNKLLILPDACAVELRGARIRSGPELRVAARLTDVVHHLQGKVPLNTVLGYADRSFDTVDMADIRGQGAARRALEVAAAGMHRILLSGPPGGGKSMLARRLPTILPPLSPAEALDVAAVHSAAGLLSPHARPFRAPHYSVTQRGICGDPRFPGEVSLAHRGVLFLDDAPEFSRAVLDALRSPLAEHVVRLPHSTAEPIVYPADVLLVLAGSPCPCGRYGLAERTCTCAPHEVQRKRLFRLARGHAAVYCEVAPISHADILLMPEGESSADIRGRVVAARYMQTSRRQPAPNGRLTPWEVMAYLPGVGASTVAALRSTLSSDDSAARVLAVARTIADLAGADTPTPAHIDEAVRLCPEYEEPA